jgi:hypothetical protein
MIAVGGVEVRRGIVVVALLALVAGAWGTTQGKAKTKDKSAGKKGGASKIDDAGSFSIFVNGKRVGTETVRIEQGATVTVATSEIKVDDGSTKAEQSSRRPDTCLWQEDGRVRKTVHGAIEEWRVDCFRYPPLSRRQW